jgi:hypothetical protein
VADTSRNGAEFGRSGSGEGASAFPKARVVALAECGTHAFVAAEVGPLADGEKTLAKRLCPRLRPDELLTGDRNFYAFDAWALAARSGAALLWRAPTGLGLPVVRVLPDGTYLSVLINPALRGARRRAAILAAAGAVADGEVGTELDPACARADELAAAYHQRWEEETGNDQLKTHLRGPGRILRSRLPELVYQEIWAWLLVHHGISSLAARAAQAADLDPDQVSFTRVLRIARRTATGTAGSPLRTGTASCPTSWPRSPARPTRNGATAATPASSNAPATTATA